MREILQEEMTRRGWNAYKLEDASGVPQPTINRILSGKHGDPRSGTIKKLAEALRMTEGQLRGLEPRVGKNESSGLQNVEPGPDIRGQVPLISWVQAGKAMEVVDLLHPGEGFEWISVTCPIKRHTYALKVNGDSMAPKFPPGILIIVEPEMEADPGDFVIAKNGDEEATFKQLVKDSGRWFLRPLNDRYPITPLEGFTVIGVVREAVLRLK